MFNKSIGKRISCPKQKSLSSTGGRIKTRQEVREQSRKEMQRFDSQGRKVRSTHFSFRRANIIKTDWIMHEIGLSAIKVNLKSPVFKKRTFLFIYK